MKMGYKISHLIHYLEQIEDPRRHEKGICHQQLSCLIIKNQKSKPPAD
jgi:hypothetical protein